MTISPNKQLIMHTIVKLISEIASTVYTFYSHEHALVICVQLALPYKNKVFIIDGTVKVENNFCFSLDSGNVAICLFCKLIHNQVYIYIAFDTR